MSNSFKKPTGTLRTSQRGTAVLNRTVPSELKAIDTVGAMVANTTGAVLLLNGISPGVALNQRIGRQCSFIRFEGHLTFYATAGTGADQTQRFLIVQDRQTNGAAPAITDVLDTATTYSLYNLSNQQRFKILWDRTVVINASAEAFTEKTLILGQRSKLRTQYNAGAAGTVADIATNGLFAISIGSNAPGATAGGIIESIRFRYFDN